MACGLGLLIVGTLCGCGRIEPARVAVSGTVLVDGQPLPKGTIHFIPEAPNRGAIVAAPIEAGRFSLRRQHGPQAGRNRIQAIATRDVGFDPNDDLSYEKAPKSANGQVDRGWDPLVLVDEAAAVVEFVQDQQKMEFRFTAAKARPGTNLRR